MTFSLEQRLHLSLLILHLGVVVVMGIWVMNKFINPEHAVAVFEKLYFVDGINNALIYALGLAQLLVITLFA